MDQKITTNFYYSEFRPNGAPENWVPTNDYQALLIRTLAENLQIVRDGVSVGLTISSGVRSLEDHDRLIQQGASPSKTSDHYCGLSIPLYPYDKDFSKYGSTYNFSIGAADIVPSKISCDDLFKIAINLYKSGKVCFGQIILEKNIQKNKAWVHFSNDPSIFFSPLIVKFILRPRFLSTIDGGKTYSLVVI